MNHRLFVLNIIGILCIAFSITLLPPIVLSAWSHDGELPDFITTFITLIVLGGLLWYPTRKRKVNLRRQDGFLVVAVFWLILSTVGSLPFMLGPHHLDIIDALFESTSGITTTGATIIPDLRVMAVSILFYRQELQWIGGMGLIVLAIAILPVLGVGGAALYRAETPGPFHDSKLTPRIAQTARNIWRIYIGLTMACATAYWLAGMNPLEAIEYSFSTVSTGGFSPHNLSLGFYHNSRIDDVAVLFMVLGGINFSVHYIALAKARPTQYLSDVEVTTFLKIIVLSVLLYSLILYGTHTYESVTDAIHFSTFEVTSVLTSTGLGVTDFSLWPTFLPVLLIFISFIGGCGGSTAGGIKVMRILILIKQALREGFLLIHPRAIKSTKIGTQILDKQVFQSVWSFFALYLVVFVILTLAMMLTGMDQVSAFAAVAACINNLGPGLGQVSATFSDVSDAAKLLAIFAMLLGRLEIFTLLIVLMPSYWRD